MGAQLDAPMALVLSAGMGFAYRAAVAAAQVDLVERTMAALQEQVAAAEREFRALVADLERAERIRLARRARRRARLTWAALLFGCMLVAMVSS